MRNTIKYFFSYSCGNRILGIIYSINILVLNKCQKLIIWQNAQDALIKSATDLGFKIQVDVAKKDKYNTVFHNTILQKPLSQK